VIIDPERRGSWRLEDLHTVDYSIWDGYAYHGAPVTTILGGRVMVHDGEFVGPASVGRFIARPARCAPPG